MIVMATMYFAKININKEIYEVYKKQENYNKILNKLIEEDWQKSKIVEQKLNTDRDDSEREIYKFINIDRISDKSYLVGRLINVFKDEIAIYDEKKDNISSMDQEKLSRAIPFYFDWKNEMVAFIPTQKFKRQRFLKYFELLINDIYGENQFSVYIMNNASDFKKQLRTLNTVSKIEITLIPPNSNKDEFDDLFPKDGDELKETGGTKFHQEIYAPESRKKGLNMDAKLVKRSVEGIAKGFGVFTATGKTTDDKKKTISSDSEAPYKKNIKYSPGDSLNEVADYGKNGIEEILISNIEKRIDI